MRHTIYHTLKLLRNEQPQTKLTKWTKNDFSVNVYGQYMFEMITAFFVAYLPKVQLQNLDNKLSLP